MVRLGGGSKCERVKDLRLPDSVRSMGDGRRQAAQYALIDALGDQIDELEVQIKALRGAKPPFNLLHGYIPDDWLASIRTYRDQDLDKVASDERCWKAWLKQGAPKGQQKQQTRALIARWSVILASHCKLTWLQLWCLPSRRPVA